MDWNEHLISDSISLFVGHDLTSSLRKSLWFDSRNYWIVCLLFV